MINDKNKDKNTGELKATTTQPFKSTNFLTTVQGITCFKLTSVVYSRKKYYSFVNHQSNLVGAGKHSSTAATKASMEKSKDNGKNKAMSGIILEISKYLVFSSIKLIHTREIWHTTETFPRGQGSNQEGSNFNPFRGNICNL